MRIFRYGEKPELLSWEMKPGLHTTFDVRQRTNAVDSCGGLIFVAAFSHRLGSGSRSRRSTSRGAHWFSFFESIECLILPCVLRAVILHLQDLEEARKCLLLLDGRHEIPHSWGQLCIRNCPWQSRGFTAIGTILTSIEASVGQMRLTGS